jgi:hypothetical protein
MSLLSAGYLVQLEEGRKEVGREGVKKERCNEAN